MPIIKRDPQFFGLSHLENKTVAQELAQIRLAKRRANVCMEPKDLIAYAISRHGKDRVAVCWSGGRCSTAVLRIATEICPDIKVFFADTGVEFPETVRYVKDCARNWGLNLIVYEPKRTFWELFDQFGPPFVRLPTDRKRGRGSKGRPACCRWLKHEPMRRFKKDHGIEAFITGIRAAEARVRMFSTAQLGQFYFMKTLGAWKYNPIVFWSTYQLQVYVAENNIPLNPLYHMGKDRVGCWPCTSFVGWREQLSRTSPNLYKLLLEKMGERRLAEHFYRSRIASCRG